MTAFAWNKERATASLLLPDGLLEQCGTWHVTLCSLGRGYGLVAVGVSSCLASMMPGQGVDPKTLTWRTHPCAPPASSILDMPLVDQASSGNSLDVRKAAGWQSRVHCGGGGSGSVTVDVLFPGPLPPKEAASVTVNVVGTIDVVGCSSSGKGGAREPLLQFRLELPPGV